MSQLASKDRGGEISKSPTLEQMLVQRRDLLAKLMPDHMSVDRFCKQAVLAKYRGGDRLQDADPRSILNAVLVAAEVGLDCSGGPLGHGYLVPFGGVVTFIPGYRGLISLARRATGVEIEARCVFEGDEFRYSYGTDPVITHNPCGEDDDGKIVAAYAIAFPRQGRPKFECMTRDQIERIRRMSKQPNGMLWTDHFHEACRKTVARRLIKWCELMGDDARGLKALEADNDQFEGDPDMLASGDAPEPDRVAAVVGKVATCPDCGHLAAINTLGDVVCSRCGVVSLQGDPEPPKKRRGSKPKAAAPYAEAPPEDGAAVIADRIAADANMQIEAASAVAHSWLGMIGVKVADLRKPEVWARVEAKYEDIDWTKMGDG